MARRKTRRNPLTEIYPAVEAAVMAHGGEITHAEFGSITARFPTAEAAEACGKWLWETSVAKNIDGVPADIAIARSITGSTASLIPVKHPALD